MRILLLQISIIAISFSLMGQESNVSTISETSPTQIKRAVFAIFPENGYFYKGDVIEEKDGKSLILWAPPGNSPTPEPSWVNSSDVYGTLEALIHEGKKPREVYAEYGNGLFYKATAIIDKDDKTLIYWADGSRPDWVLKKNVRPRKGHGLKNNMLGDRELSPAEKAKEAKANKQYEKERANEFSTQCRNYKTRLDCMSTYDPCNWSGSGCQYRGY